MSHYRSRSNFGAILREPLPWVPFACPRLQVSLLRHCVPSRPASYGVELTRPFEVVPDPRPQIPRCTGIPPAVLNALQQIGVMHRLIKLERHWRDSRHAGTGKARR